jgi:pantoate kinase
MVRSFILNMVTRMECTVFAPSHITGFFEIRKHKDPLSSGSRGAGVTLDNGVYTRVECKEGEGSLKIFLNDNAPVEDNSISLTTIKILKEQYPDKLKNWDLKIKHTTKVPVGAGFGVSAACALGTAMGISYLLKLPLTFNQAASVAHQAELKLGSGLGDVIAEIHGGLVLRLKEGAPGHGKVDRLLGWNDEPLFVISKTLGEIETSHIINDPEYIQKINLAGSQLLQQLKSKPDVSEFMKLSYIFAEKTGLMDTEILEIVQILKEESIGASMAMLGRTAFAISINPDSSIEKSMVSRLDTCGCRFIE